MPRIKVTINKANTKRIIDFVKKLKKEHPVYGKWEGEENDDFYKEWFNIMKEEIRSIRDCHEKDIICAYIDEALRIAKSINSTSPESLYLASKKNARASLVKIYTDKTFDNNIDRYFNEVKKQYIEHPQNECDDLVFCDENREIFLKNNLKLVVNCAKRYQGLGVPFDDLIQAGNEGLISAFDRFDTSKANLRNSIKQKIKEECSNDEDISYDKAEKIIREGFTYDKLLDETLKKLPKNGFESIYEFYAWVDKNVKTAVFASVAFQWIRAAILVNISRQGQVIRVPNAGKGTKLADIIRLDGINPYTDDCYHDNDISKIANDEFMIEDNQLDDEERSNEMKEAIDELLAPLSITARRMMKKRYGIGLPYSMSVSELAENECVSLSTVKMTLKDAIDKILEDMTPEKREILISLMNNE